MEIKRKMEWGEEVGELRRRIEEMRTKESRDKY